MDEQNLNAEEQAAFNEMQAAENEAPQADPAETQAPEPAAGPADAQDNAAGTESQKNVPLPILLEERKIRQQVEKERAEERRRFDLLLQRFSAQQQTAQPQQQAPQAPPLPDPQADPVGHLLERLNRAELTQAQVIQAIVAQRQQADQQTQQQQMVAALQNRARAAEQEFAAATPDYTDALNFLADARHKELAALGYEDAAERQAVLSHEAMSLAAAAMQQGRNPAAVVYEMAKLRGYSAKPVQSPAAEKFQQIAQGQAQSRTLGAVRGAPAIPITGQRVSEMSAKEFSALMDKLERDGNMASVFGE